LNIEVKSSADAAAQSLSGQHIVRPDGTVGLGAYGAVTVTGLTIDQAHDAIRAHLAKRMKAKKADEVDVAVDVLAYNSKRYYMIADLGEGEQVTAFPITGSETVLDALAMLGWRTKAGHQVKLIRRTPSGDHQILPVNYKAITQSGETATNYQVMPGDRIYV